MFKKLLTAAAMSALLSAGTATAEPFSGFYIGPEITYDNGPFGFDQFTYGAVAGYNFKLTDNLYIGAEGEISGSTFDNLDFIFGGHGHIGFEFLPGTSIFARAGYRDFDFDFGINGGDFTLGTGGQIFLTDSIAVRGLVDTVGFDTVGFRAALVFEF